MNTSRDTVPKLDPLEEHYFIPSPHDGRCLFLRRLAGSPTSGAPRRAVLYVHGATFPSALSIAHRFDGRSWRDALCDAGFDVWGLDFHGFGGSDRYPEMDEPADAHGPLCLAEDAEAQLAAAVRFILERQGATSLSLLAHSWGQWSRAGSPARIQLLSIIWRCSHRSRAAMVHPTPSAQPGLRGA